MNRSEFLKNSALILSASLINNAFVKGAAITQGSSLSATELMSRLIASNDKQVELILAAADKQDPTFGRRLGGDFSTVAASYVSPQSKYYHSNLLVQQLENIAKILSAAQAPDGTVNIGNLESPPDTAFLVEVVCPGASVLAKDNSPALKQVNANIKQFLVKAGEPLVTGGVHTPNHRWVICAALAQLNHLYPNKRYTGRINEWLSEGIFQDDDGHYPERSSNYANVENNSMITMARFLNMPDLLKYARKNLATTYFYMEPNGDLVTNDSRRQDKYQKLSISIFYRHYRYIAIRDNEKLFAGIVNFIERMDSFQKDVLDRSLCHFLDNETLQKDLPPAIDPPVSYENLFTTSSLLRIRRGNTSITLFGGPDLPLTIASGRSDSPDIFSYRKGKAILKYLRLSTSFFSMGYFYSDGAKKENGNYVLQRRLSVPYYQPLPKAKQNPKGDYKLSESIDSRFWNKMDFQNRPVSNVKNLNTKVTLSEDDGEAALLFEVNGMPGVAVTIELCFAEGGKLNGVTAGTDGNSFLEKGTGQYENGGDTITFGPGNVTHRMLRNLEGERYSTHFGSLKTEGMRVYITGTTPFSHKIAFS